MPRKWRENEIGKTEIVMGRLQQETGCDKNGKQEQKIEGIGDYL